MNNTDMHVGHVHFAVVKEITKEDLKDHNKIFWHISREQQCCIESKTDVQALP